MIIGSEAVIEIKKNSVIKKRIEKKYRINEIDTTLRKSRTRSECKLIREARRAGVTVPKILKEDDFSIELEKINGSKVKDILNTDIAYNIGQYVAKLHNFNIIHGDLTTSNMIFSSSLYFIDFGLGFQSSKIEDKAMDLHVFKECIKSTHFDIFNNIWDCFIKGYNDYKDHDKVIKTLLKIEKRGRYKVR